MVLELCILVLHCSNETKNWIEQNYLHNLNCCKAAEHEQTKNYSTAEGQSRMH